MIPIELLLVTSLQPGTRAGSHAGGQASIVYIIAADNTMVNFCAIYGCSNRSNRETNKSFYRLPAVIRNQGERTEELSLRR